MRSSLVLHSIALLFVTTSCAQDLQSVQGNSPSDAESIQRPSPEPGEEQALALTVSSELPDDGAYVMASEETNIRSGPGTMFEVIGTLMPGQQYIVTGSDQDWLQLEVNGAPAWVFSTLVTIGGDPPSITDLNSSPSSGSPATETFEGQDCAITHIRGFLLKADLALAFVELTLMINSLDANRQVAVFNDEIGTRYSVDPSTYVLAQIEPSGLHFQAGDPIAPDALRRIAHDLAERSPGFSDNKSTLRYEEGLKDEVHFFVWIDQEPGWKFNRPQLQVGILDDGTLFTYMNTLIWAP